MLRLLADENFNGDIVRGLLLRNSNVDMVTVQNIGLQGATDPHVLKWAAENNRIVVTHDRRTMPHHAYQRLCAEEPVAGVFVIDDRFPVGKAIDELLFLNECSELADWDGRIVYLPL